MTPAAEQYTSAPPPLAGGGWGEGAERPTSLLARARAMRHDPSPTEEKLWRALRRKQTAGIKFRRQVPLGRYIADFYCAAAKLVVEVDGVSHVDSQTDAARDAWMRAQGLSVLRISNRDVFSNIEGVLLAIQQAACLPPPPIPLPQGEGEETP